MRLYKYHGAGNDFLIADGRDKSIALSAGQIQALCNRHTGIGADGMMILQRSAEHDFRMLYYNSDGSGGMMCGNGGRCIVAFAADLGYDHFTFEAPDGIHEAEIYDPSDPQIAALVDAASESPGQHIPIADNGKRFTPFSSEPRIVRLKMRDVLNAVPYGRLDISAPDADWFLNTGTRHIVRFVDNAENVDVVKDGRKLRYDGRFAPDGVNVNFVEAHASETVDGPYSITVRTYEKGVENETLACGTGIVASALANHLRLHANAQYPECRCGHCTCLVQARIAKLSVSFDVAADSHLTVPDDKSALPLFSNIWLTGPAAFIGAVETP